MSDEFTPSKPDFSPNIQDGPIEAHASRPGRVTYIVLAGVAFAIIFAVFSPFD
jgi:hypothetical protein